MPHLPRGPGNASRSLCHKAGGPQLILSCILQRQMETRNGDFSGHPPQFHKAASAPTRRKPTPKAPKVGFGPARYGEAFPEGVEVADSAHLSSTSRPAQGQYLHPGSGTSCEWPSAGTSNSYQTGAGRTRQPEPDTGPGLNHPFILTAPVFSTCEVPCSSVGGQLDRTVRSTVWERTQRGRAIGYVWQVATVGARQSHGPGL